MARRFCTEYCYDIILDNDRKIEASYLHRGTEACEENDCEWEVSNFTISEEPVWLVYVNTREDQ